MKYCPECGALDTIHKIETDNHLHCSACPGIQYQNPKPVSVLLQPIEGPIGYGIGLIIGKRGDNGGWALPGGFMEVGETMGQAAMRELREEADNETLINADTAFVGEFVTPNGGYLVFVRSREVWPYEKLNDLRPTAEMTEWAIYTLGCDKTIVFSSHADFANQVLSGLLR